MEAALPDQRADVRRLVSFVVPVYRNVGAISRTYAEINRVLEPIADRYDHEFVFVNDGSDDGSLEEIKGLRAADPRVKLISFTRNFGQMAAMLAGFEHAIGDAVVNISADLQDPAELVPQMIAQWDQGAEIVICYRTDRADNLSAKLLSKFAYFMLRLSIPDIPPGGFDFVLMDREVMRQFNSTPVRNRFFQGDLLWPGFRTNFIPYVRQKRTIGKSQYNLRKKAKNFMDAFLDASYLPIRFISGVGVVTSLLGVLYAATVVISWLLHRTPFSGWAPIMVAVMVIGGIIMLMLGIIGEYVWRIYDEVRGKPNYVIREKEL